MACACAGATAGSPPRRRPHRESRRRLHDPRTAQHGRAAGRAWRRQQDLSRSAAGRTPRRKLRRSAGGGPEDAITNKNHVMILASLCGGGDAERGRIEPTHTCSLLASLPVEPSQPPTALSLSLSLSDTRTNTRLALLAPGERHTPAPTAPTFWASQLGRKSGGRMRRSSPRAVGRGRRAQPHHLASPERACPARRRRRQSCARRHLPRAAAVGAAPAPRAGRYSCGLPFSLELPPVQCAKSSGWGRGPEAWPRVPKPQALARHGRGQGAHQESRGKH